jgi:hypothetical protein
MAKACASSNTLEEALQRHPTPYNCQLHVLLFSRFDINRGTRMSLDKAAGYAVSLSRDNNSTTVQPIDKVFSLQLWCILSWWLPSSEGLFAVWWLSLEGTAPS